MSRHALLVTGSRSLAENEAARAWATEQLRGVVGSLPDGTVVLTGGADGPDAWATWMAEQRGLAWVEWHADGSRCSSLGGPSSWLPPPRGAGTPVVWTARVGYRGSDGLDVTRKSAGADGLPFAPSWAILSPELDARRRGEDAAARWPAYVAAYEHEMRESERRDPGAWQRLLGRESVTLLCYCTDPAHCHRSVLARMLGARGARVCGERPSPLARNAAMVDALVARRAAGWHVTALALVDRRSRTQGTMHTVGLLRRAGIEVDVRERGELGQVRARR